MDEIWDKSMWQGIVLLVFVCYVDEMQFIYHNADSVLLYIHQIFPVKVWFGDQEIYLGTKFVT